MFSLDEPDKHVVILVRRPPLGSQKGGEALRMAVGQSAANQVTVILVDAGVWLASPLKPDVLGGGEIGKWLDMLLDLDQKVWVEAESMERYGLRVEQIHAGVEVVTRQQVDQELLAGDAVIVS